MYVKSLACLAEDYDRKRKRDQKTEELRELGNWELRYENR